MLALLAGGLCSLVVPSAALAVPAGIGVMDEPSASTAKIISYTAGPGEQNNVTVELVGTNYIVTDSGATSIPDLDGSGSGCEPVSPTQYTCPDPNAKATCYDPYGPLVDDRIIRRVTIRAGDGRDTVTLATSVTADSVVSGQAGDDILNGGPCSDWITGGPKSGSADDDDTIYAGAGTDHLEGGIGDDELHPGLGDDVLGAFGVVGGLGTDTVSYSERTTQNVRVDISDLFGGLAGATAAPCTLSNSYDWVEIDTIDKGGSSGVENVEGGQGDDCITGTRGANTISGGPGADLLSGEQGNDTVDYSERTNPVTVSLGDSPANDGEAGEGDNVLSDVENIVGGAGDDRLIGQDRIAPTAGQNGREGSEGVNRLSGGRGNDILDGQGDADSFEGNEGVDRVIYLDRTAPIVGSIGDGTNDDGGAEDVNNLISTRADSIGGDVEQVVGGAGNDVLRGTGDPNFLDGAGGDDVVNGGGGNDEIDGGPGDDALEGSGDDDVLRGGTGLDDLEGGDGADLLEGGGDEDVLDGGSGPDTLSGGPGGDEADYSSRLGPVAASADGAGGDGEAGEGDNILDDVESLTGGIDDDTLVGNSAGGLLDGGGGDDLLDGGGGPDDLVGGPGADLATYAGRTAPVTVDLTTFGGDGEAGEDDEISDDVEKVTGGAGNDILIGDGAGNILHGGEGVDNINGGDGFDLLHGDGGNDNLNGAGGTDQVYGDGGNDSLLGGGDADTLHGGANDDSLDGGTGADILNGNEGSDTANYAARTSALNVTLDGAPNDGQSGEGDLVKTDVENVTTGSGNDNVNSADGVTGRVSCGRGTDTVSARDTSDTIDGDCESVSASRAPVCSLRAASGGKMNGSGVVRLRVNCPVAGKSTVTLRKGNAKIGSKRFSVRAGKVKTVKVKLSRKGRRAVNKAKRNRLRVRATLSSIRSGKVAATRVTRATITIKAPR